jgi:hypothetical protein
MHLQLRVLEKRSSRSASENSSGQRERGSRRTEREVPRKKCQKRAEPEPD